MSKTHVMKKTLLLSALLPLITAGSALADGVPASEADEATINLPMPGDPSATPPKPTVIPKASGVSSLGNSGLIKPGESEALERSYVTGVDEISNNWHMVYGPLHSQDKSIRYAIHRPNGFIDFSCSSDGRQEVVIGVAGFRKPKGETVTASITISDIQHDATLSVTGDISKNAQESVLYMSGNDVGGILNTMSRMHSEQAIEDAIIIRVGGREISAPSPVPYQEAATVMQVCAGWHNHALAAALDSVK